MQTTHSIAQTLFYRLLAYSIAPAQCKAVETRNHLSAHTFLKLLSADAAVHTIVLPKASHMSFKY